MALDKTDVKRKVIDIAAGLIAEGGSEALQARAIAKKAGISVGSIYNLVGDMDTLHRLVNAELLDHLGAMGAETIAHLDAAGVTDLRQRLLGLSYAYLDFTTAHARQWDALLAFNRTAPSHKTPEWYAVRLEMLFDIIGDALKDTPIGGQSQRTIAARALWSAVHGIVTNTFVGRTDQLLKNTAREQIDLLVTMFVRGLEASGGDGEPALAAAQNP